MSQWIFIVKPVKRNPFNRQGQQFAEDTLDAAEDHVFHKRRHDIAISEEKNKTYSQWL